MDGGRSLEFLSNGDLLAPSGVRYRRTPERVKRANAQSLIDAGCPVATDVYPEGLSFYEGASARRAWVEIAPRLVVGKPPRVRDLQWTGHVWVSNAGDSLLYFHGDH
jgi:hypothetical protein